ncbi:MAG: hypothetical protein HZR80_00995 [Candidatus Heimdallarchaeota archaeon]
MSKLTFIELAKKVLDEEKKALSPMEIWEIAKLKGYVEKLGSKGISPERTLWAVLYRDEMKTNSPFILIDERPKRYALKSLHEKGQVDIDYITDVSEPELTFNEQELHPYLTYFCFEYLSVYTKTINHSKSRKMKFGEWVHPDMVGWWFGPIKEWKELVREFSKSIQKLPIKLYSFEIKKALNFNNLREAFFQAVSNSSWANEGYLVAHEIAKEEDFINELTRLSSSFGIGVIQLDIYDPGSSEIVLPATFKEYLDWDSIDKLSLNSDFADFLERVKKDLIVSEVREEGYDKVFESEDLIKKLRK